MRTQVIRTGVLLCLGLVAALTVAACTAGNPPNTAGAVGSPSRHPTSITPTKSPGTATPAVTLAGGVLGDVTGDGLADILAIDPAGSLWLYPNTGSAGAGMFTGGRLQVGSGWTRYTLAAVAPLYGASRAGLLAIDSAGDLWYYPNTGATGISTFTGRVRVGIGWKGYTVAGIADLYGTSPASARTPEIVAIASVFPFEAGTLLYYNNTGGTGLSTFIGSFIGLGWTGYTADLADINGDGKPDILAVDSSGSLWLYPGTGSVGNPNERPFPARSQVGSGWIGYQAIVAGQLTSTGPASILAVDRAGDLWYYPNTAGTGLSAFGARVQVGTGWTGYRIN